MRFLPVFGRGAFRRSLVIALLALGVIGGYASGFHSLRAHLHGHARCACTHDDGAAAAAPAER